MFLKVTASVNLNFSEYCFCVSKMANTTDISQFLIPNEVPFNFLECKKAFAGLTAKEKLYAHYLCRASWQGALICLLQTSPESPGIFLLFQKIFSAESVESFCAAAQQGESGLSDNEIKVCYCCHVTFTLESFKQVMFLTTDANQKSSELL